MEEQRIKARTRRQDVRRVLWQWGDTMRLCARKMAEIEAMQAMIDDARQLSAGANDGMPRGTGVSNPTERGAIRVEKIIESFSEGIDAVQESIDRAMRLKMRIDELLEDLPPEQRMVLELRYIEGRSWVYVGFKMNAREDQARRWERQAIESVGESISIM